MVIGFQPVDDLVYVKKISVHMAMVISVGMRMLMGVFVAVGMFMAMGMFMLVDLLMGMDMLMDLPLVMSIGLRLCMMVAVLMPFPMLMTVLMPFPMFMTMPMSVLFQMHIKIIGIQPAHVLPPKMQMISAHSQASKSVFQHMPVRAQIQKRPNRHISADP